MGGVVSDDDDDRAVPPIAQSSPHRLRGDRAEAVDEGVADQEDVRDAAEPPHVAARRVLEALEDLRGASGGAPR